MRKRQFFNKGQKYLLRLGLCLVFGIAGISGAYQGWQMPTPGTPYTAKVIWVSDGDTLTVTPEGNQQNQKIRVHGIDCPETSQPYGLEAAEVTRSWLGHQVLVEPLDTDKYGRTVAVIRLANGRSLQDALLESGAAWYFERFCRVPACADWQQSERAARAKRIGLWANSNPIPPWTWRNNF